MYLYFRYHRPSVSESSEHSSNPTELSPSPPLLSHLDSESPIIQSDDTLDETPWKGILRKILEEF